MPAGDLGTVWKADTWAHPAYPWEANTWATAVATYQLMTEGTYMMIDLGGGVIYLKPLSPTLEANISTGHVGVIT